MIWLVLLGSLMGGLLMLVFVYPRVVIAVWAFMLLVTLGMLARRNARWRAVRDELVREMREGGQP